MDYKVETSETSVRILDQAEEVLYWDLAEWAESPETCLVIINAIVMALTDSKEFEKTIKKKKAAQRYPRLFAHHPE